MAAVVGTMFILASYPVLISAAGIAIVDHVTRDEGYITSPSRTLSTSGTALVSDRLDLYDMPMRGTGMMRGLVGDVRVRVSSPSGKPIFAGIAATRDVMAYLHGTNFVIIDSNGSVVRRELGGGRAAAPPLAQRIWTSSTQGRGPQSLVWSPEPGSWSLVVMSSSGRSGVDARMDVGAEAPGLDNLAWTLFALGGLLFVGGASLVTVAVRRTNRSRAERSSLIGGSTASA